jgi:hypothetical protein
MQEECRHRMHNLCGICLPNIFYLNIFDLDGKDGIRSNACVPSVVFYTVALGLTW